MASLLEWYACEEDGTKGRGKGALQAVLALVMMFSVFVGEGRGEGRRVWSRVA